MIGIQNTNKKFDFSIFFRNQICVIVMLIIRIIKLYTPIVMFPYLVLVDASWRVQVFSSFAPFDKKNNKNKQFHFI